MNRILFPILVLLFLSACDGTSKKAPEFPYIELPAAIGSQMPDEKRLYLLNHFWRRYIACAKEDTTLFHIEEKEFEKAYTEYLRLLIAEPDYKRAAALQKELIVTADSFAMAGNRGFLMELIKYNEHYLYNANSPYLNEELYIPVLEALMEAKSLDSLSRIPYGYQLGLALLNRVGERANDFPYLYLRAESRLPEKSTLYRTEGEYLLLYFNNPGCISCRRIKQFLEQNSIMASMIREKRLVILSLYVDGERSLWYDGYKDFPKEWIYAMGEESAFSDNSLYGLRAIPSFYLLNKEKIVLLKDAPVERVMEYLLLLVQTQK